MFKAEFCQVTIVLYNKNLVEGEIYACLSKLRVCGTTRTYKQVTWLRSYSSIDLCENDPTRVLCK